MSAKKPFKDSLRFRLTHLFHMAHNNRRQCIATTAGRTKLQRLWDRPNYWTPSVFVA